MRISTAEFYQRGLDSLVKKQSELSKSQEKIATGKRILTPSDDPTNATRALNLRQDLNKIDQFIRNAEFAKTSLEFEESVLHSITNNYQRAQELIIMAGNGALSNSDKFAVAVELEQRLDELKSLVNSKNEKNEYLFAGFRTNTKPVTKNIAGEYVYNGDNGQRQSLIAASTLLNISDNGFDLFFNLPSHKLEPKVSYGITNILGTQPGLLPASSLSSIQTEDLIINNIKIKPSTSDLISSNSSNGSAIAIANAINAQKSEHNVTAVAEANIIDLGIFSPNPINLGEFKLNGIEILNPAGSEVGLLNAINNLTSLTGVSAEQPLGAGTAISLIAADGRNIQLTTNGISLANFANFDLTSGANDVVKRAAISLRSQESIDIQGANPNNIGFNRGNNLPLPNSGNCQVESINITNMPDNTQANYSIIFDASGTNFSVVNDLAPNTPLLIDGYTSLPYKAGKVIEFAGFKVTLNNTPAANDILNFKFTPKKADNIFNTYEDLIVNIKSGIDNNKLTYDLGVALTNIKEAETILLAKRAELGANLNIAQSQTDYNNSIKLLAQQNLSNIEDLDYNEAITELTQKSFTLQAAQQSFMKIQGLSLFNFLH